MKNMRIFPILLVVLTLALCAFAFVSCGEEEPSQPPLQIPKKLTAPIVVLTDDTVTWSADAVADKFEISLSGNLSYIENTVTSRKLNDGETFKLRAIGDGVNYTNSDWSNTVTYSSFTPPPPSDVTYTITWKNGDLVLETDTSVKAGTMPTYDGELPTKPSDTTQSYVFSGWSPAVVPASADATYVAQFAPVTNTYTVIWKNGDVVMETDLGVTYGSTPVYNGETPQKTATEQYSYTFSGWSPVVSAVTGNITYMAQYTETLNNYIVSFHTEDGKTVLEEVTVAYGTGAVYSQTLPVKSATEGHTYIFEKWVTAPGGDVVADLANVTGDIDVYASFRAFVRTVSVYIVSSNADYGRVSVSVLDSVPFGSTIVTDENTIAIGDKIVTAQASEQTAQYTYVFSNWTTPETVGNDTVIMANFVRTPHTYTVTWKNGDTVLETDYNVVYGTVPVYNGSTPTKLGVGNTSYVFNGWSPAITAVTGDVTYVAQFSDAVNAHTVTFYDEDGVTELGRTVVEYGGTAVYPNMLPTKEATPELTFTFEKWVTAKGGDIEATFTNITTDVVVYAKYTTKTRMYTVTFNDFDGTLLEKVEVPYGGAASASVEPERSGFRFDTWSGLFDHVTSDITVSAKYVQQFVVEFLNDQNGVIDVQLVDYNTDAIAPVPPVRDGYKFVGWSTGFKNILGDLTVQAQYVKQYKVTFLAYDGEKLNEMWVDAGGAAEAPVPPLMAGYTFVAWDQAFNCVTADMIVTAVYELKTYTVTFTMPDGTLIETQTVEHVFAAVSPQMPAYYLAGEGSLDKKSVFSFTKWNCEEEAFSRITADKTIQAVYDTPYTEPLIVLEYDGDNVNLYLFGGTHKLLKALEFTIDYGSEGDSNIKMIEASNDTASSFWKGDNKKYQSVINNNENLYTFAWTDATGKQLNLCSLILEFVNEADGTSVTPETFNITTCTAVVSDTDGENLEKVIPVVVAVVKGE